MPEWADIPQILKVAINPIDSNLISNEGDVWDHPLIDSFVEKCNFLFLGYGCSIEHNQVNIGSVMVSEVSKYGEINYPAEYVMQYTTWRTVLMLQGLL